MTQNLDGSQICSLLESIIFIKSILFLYLYKCYSFGTLCLMGIWLDCIFYFLAAVFFPLKEKNECRMFWDFLFVCLFLRSVVVYLLQTVKNQGNCIGDQYKETLDLGQQLKLEREQLQHTHSELVETRRMLVQAQREADRLLHELEELNHLSQEKVTECFNISMQNIHSVVVEFAIKKLFFFLKGCICLGLKVFNMHIVVLFWTPTLWECPNSVFPCHFTVVSSFLLFSSEKRKFHFFSD